MLRQAISTKAGQWASYFVQMSRRRAYAHLRASSTHVHTESSTENNATEQKKQLVLLDFLPLVYKSYYASKYLDISLPFSQVFGPEGAFATGESAPCFSGTCAVCLLLVFLCDDVRLRCPWECNENTHSTIEYGVLFHQVNCPIGEQPGARHNDLCE